MNERFAYKRLTASARVTEASDQSGALGGIFCSTGGGTIKIYDNQAATGEIIIDTFTPVAGVSYAFPALFGKGIYVEITGSPVITVFFA